MPEDKTDNVYEQWREVMTYDADSLRAVALFLNKHKKNREFMKQASAEMGRNARNMARAVDYFPPWFTDASSLPTADDLLKLFAYAQLNRETATELFAKNGFDYPLYVIRERVAVAKSLLKGERKPTLAERCAELVRKWRAVEGNSEVVYCYHECADALVSLPEVAKVLKNGDA